MDYSNAMARISLQKLHVGNCYLWSNRIEVIQRVRGLWCFGEGVQTAGGSPEDQSAVRKKDQAIFLLFVSIEDECIAPVISLRDPSVIGSNLKEM